MSVLAVDAGDAGVTAAVVTSDGTVLARAHEALTARAPRAGWSELPPEEVWRATLGAVRAALAAHDGEVGAVAVTARRGAVVLWDRETLGSPRPAVVAGDTRAADVCARLRAEGAEARFVALAGARPDPGAAGPVLAWLAGHEPHTWSLVRAGRYAVGTLESYLLARMTRGTWHATDAGSAAGTSLLDLAAGDWSAELCDLLDVPRDALPELVPTWGGVARTEPRALAGLAVPVAALAGAPAATLAGQGCLAPGEAGCTYEAGPAGVLRARVAVPTGTAPVRDAAGLAPTVAWRSPAGTTTYAVTGGVEPRPGGAGSADPRAAVASAVADLLAGLPVTSLHVDGAPAADDALCRLQADRAGVPVLRTAAGPTAALGAALLAGLGAGLDAEAAEEPGRSAATRPADGRFDPRG